MMMTMMRMRMTMMAFVEPGHTEMDRREGSHCLQEYSKKQRNWALLLLKMKNLFETMMMTVRASTLLVLLLLLLMMMMTKKTKMTMTMTVRASPLLSLLLVSWQLQK